MRAPPLAQTPVRCLLLGLALLPAGCFIHSTAPLSDPNDAPAYEKLFGSWVSQSKDNRLTLTIRKVPAAGYPPGVMMLSFTDNPGNYTLCFVTELKGNTYMNLCGGWVRRPDELPAWDKARNGPFGIAKFSVADNVATLWQHDDAVLQEAVQRGKLKGIIKKPAPGDFGSPAAVLQESTAELVQFLLREDERVFKTKGVFKRIP